MGVNGKKRQRLKRERREREALQRERSIAFYDRNIARLEQLIEHEKAKEAEGKSA